MADKKFNITFDIDANIEPIQKSVNSLKNAFSNLKLSDSVKKDLGGLFTELNNEFENFKRISKDGFSNMGEIGQAEKSFKKITDLVNRLSVQAGKLGGIDPKKFLPDDTAIKKVQALENVYRDLEIITSKGFDLKIETEKAQSELEQTSKQVADLKLAYDEARKAKNTALEGFSNSKKSVDDLRTQIEELDKLGDTSEEATKKLEELKQQLEAAEQQLNNNRTAVAETNAAFEEAKQAFDENNKKIEELKQKLESLDPEKLRQAFADIKGVDISNVTSDMGQLKEEVANLKDEKLIQVYDALNKIGAFSASATPNVQKMGKALEDASMKGEAINERAKEIEQLANRVKYFFSIGNTVMLFRRAVKSAIDTVKDLDAVMTQAAVVTKYTVADMWAQLPQYSKRASELGVTIKGVYEASTLYYQQGLETNQVIGVANETLKMAKIAGLDYATATDYMTSALRGFNMEVNEMSAQKVNDIYSQLAAHTASNVEEISTAMSKTAPLAHNAGMEIETTAALLAQMIERTREAPETLGTAMKTVIARFQELKKDPALIEPVDGEIVDANKVETALRTIGVSLRDTSGQFRELDDVFLEISEKWDGLSTNTQRYIATIAAGSRQQSRFIAMMADYKRTTDLVALANNAAGASADQFAKTQDSLESKINRLKTAWQQFTMGLANNQVIKTVIDLLTKFIETVNKITNKLSGKSSFLKSFWDLAALGVGIKTAKALFNGFFAWLLKDSGIKGLAAGLKAGKGFGTGISEFLGGIKKSKTLDIWKNALPKDADLTSFQQASKNLANLRLEQQKLVESGQKTGAVLSGQLGAATRAYNTELNKLGLQLNLTNKQQEVSTALQLAGVKAGVANIAAVNGLTMEEIEEIVAKGKLNKLTQEEINKEIQAAAATKAHAAAEGLNNKQEKMSLATRAKLVVQLLFKGKAERKAALEALNMAAADETATVAQTALNAAMLACPIGLILLGIGLIVGAYAAWQYQANATARALKAAEEATKRSKEAADEAKQAYDDLLSDQSSYNEAQKALEDLTYGTQEWRDALVEANQQVLELLQKYPELTGHIGRGEFGQLTIDATGWDEVIAEAQNLSLILAGIAIRDKNQERKLQNDLTAEKTGYNKYKYKYGEDFEALETALLNGDKEGVKEAEDSLGLSKEKLKEVTDAIINYNNALKASEVQIEKSVQAFFTSVISPEKAEQVGTKALGNLAEAYAKNENANETYSLKDFMANPDVNWNMDPIFEELQKTYDVNINTSATNIKALRTMYAKMTGKTVEEIKEDFGNDSAALREAIIDFANTDEMKKQINKMADEYLALNDAGKQVVDILTSNGDGYREALLEQVLNLDKAGRTFVEELFGEDYITIVSNMLETARTQRDAAIKSLTDIDLNLEGFEENLTTGALTGLSERLLQIYEVSGRSAAQAMLQQIQNTIKDWDTEDAEEFVGALNSIDWKNVDEIDLLSDRLIDLKKSGKITDVQCESLEKQIKDLAKAARTVDLEKVAEQVKNLSKIQYNIQHEEGKNSFSEEEYKSLIDAGVASAGDFVYNLATDSWNYISGSMDTLSEAIEENTKALLGLDTLESDVRSSEAAKEVRNEFSNIDKTNASELYHAIVSYMAKAGEDNDIVGTDWLIDHKDDAEALLEKWEQILGEAYELEQRKTQVEETKAQGEQIRLQNNTTQENAQLAINGNEDALKTLYGQAQSSIPLEVYDELRAKIDAVTESRKANQLQNLAETAAIYNEAQAWSVDSSEITNYANSLMMTNPAIDRATASQIALNNVLLNTGLNEIISSYDEWTRLIDESTGQIKVSTNEDAAAFDKLKKGVQKMVGATEDLSDAFWQNIKNIDAMKRAAEGDFEAIEVLQKAAAADYLMNIDVYTEVPGAKAEIDNFINYLNTVDIPKLEAGVKWDDTGSQQFIEAFNRMVACANLSAEQIQEAAQRMGFSAEITYVNTLRKVPIYSQTERRVENKDGTATIYSGTPVVDHWEVIRGQFPVVKTFTSTGTGGGGINVSNAEAAGENLSKGSGSGGGGGGSEKEEEPWENPYDWLYNLTQKINEELRTREKLERRYNRLLKTHLGSGKDLKNITDQEIESLKKRREYEVEMIKLRRQELKEYLAANAALAKYATIDWELEVVRIDWAEINAVTDQEEGEAIEKYIDKLEELIDYIKEAEDVIEDIDDDLVDIKERGRDQYQDLEDRVLDALISEQQQLIDEQERIYDAINDAASDLMDAISKNIEKVRQDRQNEETETSLAEKERRLAYLRQDTTGSNALEIKKLEQDLDKEKQNYTDTLIDQGLNDLKEQNDYAAEQREKQIELMQSTLDWQQQTGYWVDEATRIVQEGLGPDGVMSKNTRMYQLLYEQEGVITNSNASRDRWDEDLADSIAQAFVWLKGALADKGVGEEAAQGDTPEGIKDKMVKNSYRWWTANTQSEQTSLSNNQQTLAQSYRDKTGNNIYSSDGKWYNEDDSLFYGLDESTIANSIVDKMKENEKQYSGDALQEYNSFLAEKLRILFNRSKTITQDSSGAWWIDGELLYNKRFKTGGLADFTGPAWLDGTKSKPEMVLNAKDTENFLQLKDILSNLRMSFSGSKGALGGDWYFNIDINVGEIANDYDVDQLTERVKQSIYTESTYRNVNAINFLK